MAGIFVLTVAGVLAISFFWMFFYSPKIKEIRVTNLTNSSATAVFTTTKPTMGWICGFFSPFYHRGDDHQRKLTTHYITITDLKENTEYDFWVGAGLRPRQKISFTTEKINEEITSPNAVYGRVFLNDGRTPADSAIVLITVEDKTFAGLTNPQGGYAIDIGQTDKNKKPEEVEVLGGVFGKVKLTVNYNEDQPVKNLILR